MAKLMLKAPKVIRSPRIGDYIDKSEGPRSRRAGGARVPREGAHKGSGARCRGRRCGDRDCGLPCPGYSLPTTKRRQRAAPAGRTIMLTRRKFIGTTLPPGAALTTRAQQARPQGASKRTIVDAQVHLWKANSPDWAWDPGARPQLPEPFTIERALPMMDEAGVDRVVIVPAGVNDRNDYALEAAKRYPDRFAVMARVRLHNPKPPAPPPPTTT